MVQLIHHGKGEALDLLIKLAAGLPEDPGDPKQALMAKYRQIALSCMLADAMHNLLGTNPLERQAMIFTVFGLTYV